MVSPMPRRAEQGASMSFFYLRTVRFQDTDAAGVVYFANVLSICHEAYEASLLAAGIDLNAFFRGEIAMPIVHAEIDYFQPMLCGEEYSIEVMPIALSPDKFKIQYAVRATEQTSEQTQIISRAATVHLCIQAANKSRRPLPPEIEQWLNLTQSQSK
jgi:1,4-dihydroxy-2-naphthoyl-CoA hydrolase